MRRTVHAQLGSYSGEKCPACKATLQVGGAWPTAAGVLAAHWQLVHLGQLPDPGPPASPPTGGPAQGQLWP